jgi:N-hydroxyarylamine O-acetyltransferase
LKLQRYLDRINYGGSLEPSFATLAALQEAHVCSVPFENLDVQLGRPLSTSIQEAYEKIVINMRGGWCYEQNGLFGWALSEIGFDVCRIAASVMRQQKGTASEASHLCLLVQSPDSKTKYLADVGFGGSMIKPIALEEAQYDQPPFKLGLEKLEDGYWRFWENPGDGKFSFDFLDEPARESSLAKKCANLQSDPSSSFVLNLAAQLRTRDRHFVLRGRVFTVARSGASKTRTLSSPEELVSVLTSEFHLDVHEVADLWPRITARHEELFGAESGG